MTLRQKNVDSLIATPKLAHPKNNKETRERKTHEKMGNKTGSMYFRCIIVLINTL